MAEGAGWVYTAARRLVAFGALAVASVGLAACGGAGHGVRSAPAPTATTGPAGAGAGAGAGGGDALPAGVVAQIGRTAISQATLDHWTAVQSISDYETSPRGPVPNWVVAKPPGYTACIAHLQAIAAKNAATQPTRSVSKLKSECQQEHEAIRSHALAVLIHYVWVFGEAAKLGINPAGSEVQQISARFKREVFGSEAAFRKFLKLTGLTLSEEMMRIKANILAERIERKLSGQGHSGKEGIAKFAEGYTESWTAKTNCRPGYVIPGCKQYNGPH